MLATGVALLSTTLLMAGVRQAPVIGGQVVARHSSQPLARVQVSVWSSDSGPPAATVSTDEQGYFQLLAPKARALRLSFAYGESPFAVTRLEDILPDSSNYEKRFVIDLRGMRRGEAYFADQVQQAVLTSPEVGVPYPDELISTGITGIVVAEFILDTLGRVEAGSLRITGSSAPEFTMAVKRAIPGMRWSAARIAGIPVRQHVRRQFTLSPPAKPEHHTAAEEIESRPVCGTCPPFRRSQARRRLVEATA